MMKKSTIYTMLLCIAVSGVSAQAARKASRRIQKAPTVQPIGSSVQSHRTPVLPTSNQQFPAGVSPAKAAKVQKEITKLDPSKRQLLVIGARAYAGLDTSMYSVSDVKKGKREIKKMAKVLLIAIPVVVAIVVTTAAIWRRKAISDWASNWWENDKKLNRWLKEKGFESVNDDSGGTLMPLQRAIMDDNLLLVKLLLNAGAQVNAIFGDSTPLHYAAMKGNEDIVKLLLERGADLEATDVYQGTSLYSAIEGKSEATVRLLLDKGANLKAKDSDGDTPLHWAAIRGAEDIVKLLLDRKADVEAKNRDGDTPQDVALDSNIKKLLTLKK